MSSSLQVAKIVTGFDLPRLSAKTIHLNQPPKVNSLNIVNDNRNQFSQQTSITTAVAVNDISVPFDIAIIPDAINAGTSATFTVTNADILADSIVTVKTLLCDEILTVYVKNIEDGQFNVVITNPTVANILAGYALTLTFYVV